MLFRFFRRLFFSFLILTLSVSWCFAQNAGDVLRVSIGFNNLRKEADNLSRDKLDQVDDLSQKAREATTNAKYGDALKYYFHAIVLLRGSAWTPEVALSTALFIKPERFVIEPGTSLHLYLSQLFSLDEKVPGQLSGSLELQSLGNQKTTKEIKQIDQLEPDFLAHPGVIELVVPEMEPGKYRLILKLKSERASSPIVKSVLVHIERGIYKTLSDLKNRAALIEDRLSSSTSASLKSALYTARYQIGLIDAVNAGKTGHEHLNFSNELKDVKRILDEIEAGRDPFIARRGDFRKAYLSKVDHTLQPYRLFVPSTYDGSKPFPLIIALHGMGGDENSYFDEYGAGAFRTEAEKRGYLVACPKGRTPASMYLGAAEQDVMDVIEEMKKAYRIDPDRIYLTGHSMGGFGTWSIAMNHPNVFAALAPVAAGGNPTGMSKIAHIPQLVIHGEKDKVVPINRSRIMIEAAKKLNVELKYLVIPNGDHDSVALQTFRDVFDWFDTHQRGAKTDFFQGGEKTN